jgi:cytochrome P450
MGTRLGRWLSKVLVKLLVPRKIDECRRVHFQKTLEATERRMGEDSSHPDVIWHVLQSNKDDLVLAPREEIILNMALFLSAGSETTSILLTALSWLIASHTDVRERLVHEIRFKFRSSGEVTLDTVTDSHLPYLNATINEAFRLFPPAGLAAAREIPAPGETIDGYALPEGTAVRVAGWALARSGSYFHKPNEFHPERWLSPPPKEFEDDRLEVSRPFIVGPRHCLGAPLAIFETQLAMTRLLLEFDVSLPTASPHTEGRGKWSLDPSTREFMSYSVIKKPDTWLSLRPVTRTE